MTFYNLSHDTITFYNLSHDTVTFYTFCCKLVPLTSFLYYYKLSHVLICSSVPTSPSTFCAQNSVCQILHFTDVILGLLSVNLTALYKFKNPFGQTPDKTLLISTLYFHIKVRSYEKLRNILTSHIISKLSCGPVILKSSPVHSTI
jgi:hypothetical protein